MLCSNLMKRDVERCLDTSRVVEAAIAMCDRDIGFLPVCDEHRVIVGTLTDRDIVVRAIAEGRGASRTVVADVMTREAITCRPEDELAVAEDAMMRFRKSRVACVDAERRVVGVISLSDLAKVEPDGHAGRVAAAVALREAAAAQRPRAARELRCRDVMKSDVACCAREETLATVARLMRRRNVGFVPVCDDDGAVIGAVTDRDIVIRAVATGRAPEQTSVGTIFTPELASCSPDDPLDAAEDLMEQHKRSRIVCTDGARRPVGVVSLSDVARVEGVNRVARVLRAVSSRSTHAWP